MTKTPTAAVYTFAADYKATVDALEEAHAIAKPLDVETQLRLRERMTPDAYTAMEAEVAIIASTIPELTAKLDRLQALACPRCSGTGDYSAPTKHVRRGRPVCFTCDGTGRRPF